MLDTLMVLLMRGFRKPWLRTLVAVLLICTGVSTVFLFIASNSLKWPDLSATASIVPATSQQPSISRKPISIPTPLSSSVPVIQQNTCLASPTPIITTVPRISHTFTKAHQSAPTPIDTTNGSLPDQNPSPFGGSFDPFPKQIFTGYASKNPPEGCLSNNLATSANRDAISALGPLFWELLAVVSLLLGCSLSLFGLASHSKRLR